MIIDPRSFQQCPAILQRISDSEFHTFLLAGSRVLGNVGVTDNKKWYFKGDNTPEVIKFLKENRFQVQMTPYYMSPIPMTAPMTNSFDGSTPIFPKSGVHPLSMAAWFQPESQEFAGVMVNRALYHDKDIVIVIDLIDNFKDYTEGLISILSDREKYNPSTFSSQENIDAIVNIATSVMARLKHTANSVTDKPNTVNYGTGMNCL